MKLAKGKDFLINRPMFNEESLKRGQGITVIKGNSRVDGLIFEISPFKLKVLTLEKKEIEYLEVTPEEVFKRQTVFLFGKK